MQRTDIHRPSAINPTEYEYVCVERMKCDGLEACAAILQMRGIREAHMKMTGGTYSHHAHGGNCHICGAAAIWTVLFYHRPTNTYIRTGEDCAAKLEAGIDGDMNIFKTSLRSALELKAGKQKAEAILVAAGIREAFDIYSSNADRDPYELPYEERKLINIVRKLIQYGCLTEKQENFVRSLINKIANRAQVEEQRAKEHEEAAECPKGRVIIEGEIVGLKSVEDRFSYHGGMILKMVVKDNSGFKVYGSAPTTISIDRGMKIRFRATVTPSDDDPKFGFFKRPSNAEEID